MGWNFSLLFAARENQYGNDAGNNETRVLSFVNETGSLFLFIDKIYDFKRKKLLILFAWLCKCEKFGFDYWMGFYRCSLDIWFQTQKDYFQGVNSCEILFRQLKTQNIFLLKIINRKQ